MSSNIYGHNFFRWLRRALNSCAIAFSGLFYQEEDIDSFGKKKIHFGQKCESTMKIILWKKIPSLYDTFEIFAIFENLPIFEILNANIGQMTIIIANFFRDFWWEWRLLYSGGVWEWSD